jgi:hypothetical protein
MMGVREDRGMYVSLAQYQYHPLSYMLVMMISRLYIHMQTLE